MRLQMRITGRCAWRLALLLCLSSHGAMARAEPVTSLEPDTDIPLLIDAPEPEPPRVAEDDVAVSSSARAVLTIAAGVDRGRTYQYLSRPGEWDMVDFRRLASYLWSGDFAGIGSDQVLVRWSAGVTFTGFRVESMNLIEGRTFELPRTIDRMGIGIADADGNGKDEVVWEIPETQTAFAATIPSRRAEEPEIFSFKLPVGFELVHEYLAWRCREGKSAGLRLSMRKLSHLANGETLVNRCLDPSSPEDTPVEFSYRPTLVPFGTFNPDGGRRQSLLSFDQATNLMYLRRDAAEKQSQAQIWVDFSPYVAFALWQGRFIGDFDGDGRDDLLTYGSGLGDARIAVSHGTWADERDFHWPFRIIAPPPAMVTGDFDGDGIKDFARLVGIPRALEVALAVPIFVPRDAISWLLLPLAFPLSDLSAASPVLDTAVSDEGGVGRFEHVPPGEFGLLSSVTLRSGAALTKRVVRIKPLQVKAHAWLLFDATSDDPEIRMVGGPRKSGEPPSLVRPKVCLGYNPFQTFANGPFGKWDQRFGVCSPGYAYYSALEGDRRGPQFSQMNTPCCPLPADDILLDEHQWTRFSCPDGWLITGDRALDGEEVREVRCTKVNSERYELGPSTAGLYWGDGLSGRNQGKHVSIFQLPEAIRFGVTRQSRNSNWVDGCIGFPFGSLLITKGNNKCRSSEYRELRYRGRPGDPPAGTPVKMFPDCELIPDVSDGSSLCFEKLQGSTS